jgi:sterol desaturase/sphingolipid hydroxylase (fatty acid hydroxylase superfamily)
MVADRLLHGFDVAVLINLLARPELGPMSAATTPALYFSFLFLVFTALFLPGVFQGYASTYRLPREDFFRACGRNLWRYLRLMFIAGIVMGIVAGLLFAINGAIVKKAGDSTNEVLPFELQMVGLAVIFLVMTTLRIWFDLAEVDVVLSDQRAVRKSLWTGLQHTLRSLLRLLASYVVATLLAAIILAGGILAWMKFVAPENWLGAFVVSQLTLLLLLIPRFWQRGVAVTFWQQSMMVPVVAAAPVIPAFTPAAIPVPPATPPSPAPEGA